MHRATHELTDSDTGLRLRPVSNALPASGPLQHFVIAGQGHHLQGRQEFGEHGRRNSAIRKTYQRLDSRQVNSFDVDPGQAWPRRNCRFRGQGFEHVYDCSRTLRQAAFGSRRDISPEADSCTPAAGRPSECDGGGHGRRSGPRGIGSRTGKRSTCAGGRVGAERSRANLTLHRVHAKTDSESSSSAAPVGSN